MDDGQQVVRLTSHNPAYLRCPIERVIKVSDDEITIENERFELIGSAQGQGVGALALALQVRACLGAGVARLDAYAAGRFGAAMIGYQVWPKFGFDGRVPARIWRQLGSRQLTALGLDETTPGLVPDLTKTPQGRKLW